MDMLDKMAMKIYNKRFDSLSGNQVGDVINNINKKLGMKHRV